MTSRFCREGYFWVDRKYLKLTFSIEQAAIDELVMKEIQNFLVSLAADSSNPDEDRLVNMY